MDLSTPKKKTNISNHIPMPLTYSLYRPSSLFKQQHELLTSISSPFIPSLRIQKKVNEFQRLSMTKIEKNYSETKQHQKNQIQKRQFITQLLESPKKQNNNHIEINIKKIPERATLFLKPQQSKSQENQYEQPQNEFILSKDILYNQQPLSQQKNNDRTFLPIKIGDCLKFQSQIPKQVTNIYLNFKKNNKTQPNFIQGYIKKIDCIYYAVEKNLILHFPNGPRKNIVSLSNKCIIVKLPNILYNIVQTNLKMSIFQQIQKKSRKMIFKSSRKENRLDQILIMCHPYYIELYYLSLKQYANFTDAQNIKNPILKLNLRFSLPNCSKPRIFGISDNYLYYLPDKSTINLEYLCIETGQIKRIEGKNEQNSLKMRGYMHQKQRQKTDLTENNSNWKVGNFLLSKLASCMMHTQPEGFIHKIGQKFCINAQMCKLICCQHNKKIVCIMQLKTKKFIKKLFTQSHMKQGISYQKFVRVYQKIERDPNNNKYKFQDILIEDYSNTILNIQFLCVTKPNEECRCKIKIQTLNKEKKLIQQFTYTNLDKKYIRNIIRTIKISEKEQQSPLILQTKDNQTIIKHSSRLIFLSDKQMFRCNPFPAKNEYIQQYVYQTSNIITLCTDTGYHRFVTVNWHDLLYSFIHYYSDQPNDKNVDQITQIAENLFKLSMNTITQNNYKYQCIIKLLKGLLKLCSNEKDQKILLYKFKDNKIMIKSMQSASDKIQKICINVLNYYSINLNKLIAQFMGQDSVSQILQYIQGKNEKQKEQVNNKANIFNYGKIYLYFNSKNQRQTNEKQKIQNTEQKCNLQKQFNEIALKIFSQQKQSKLHIEPCVLISRILIKYSFMLEVSQMLKPIWDQQLNNISVEEVENILNKLDKISIVAHIIQQKLGFSIFQIYSPIIHSKQESILSPGSTLAHSNITNKLSDAYQMESITNLNTTSKSQSSILQKIGQMLMLTEIIQKQCPNLVFGKILYEDPCYFSSYIFKKFVEDYDNHLFLQLEKAIPSYLNARDKQISYNFDIAHYLPLKFWLLLFVDICGISNKMKIVKIIQQKLQSYNIIRLHQIYKNINDKLKKDQLTIVVPEYFVQYLDKHKDIRFVDLNLMNVQDIKTIDARESLQKTIKDSGQEKKIKKLIEQKQTNYENAQKLTQVQEKESKRRSNSEKKRKEGVNLKQIISNKKTQLTK